MRDYENVLLNIADFVGREIEEGAKPHDVIAALEQIKFNIQIVAQRQVEAYANLFGIPVNIKEGLDGK